MTDSNTIGWINDVIEMKLVTTGVWTGVGPPFGVLRGEEFGMMTRDDLPDVMDG